MDDLLLDSTRDLPLVTALRRLEAARDVARQLGRADALTAASEALERQLADEERAA